MERLTLDNAIKYIKEVARKNRINKEKNTIILPNSFISSNDCADKYGQVAKWLEELKSYKELEERLHKIFGEESTFSLADVIDTLEMKLSEPDKKHPVNARILTYEEADKWEEYKNLEEQGLLVRLPCKLNGTLYSVNYSNKTIAENTIIKISINDHVKRFYCIDDNLRERIFFSYRIGENVFLTREEAEKKLEEMKK